MSIPTAVKYCTQYGSLMPNTYLKLSKSESFHFCFKSQKGMQNLIFLLIKFFRYLENDLLE